MQARMAVVEGIAVHSLAGVEELMVVEAPAEAAVSTEAATAAKAGYRCRTSCGNLYRPYDSMGHVRPCGQRQQRH